MIKNKRTMKRKIPLFRVQVEPGADYLALTKIPGIKQAVLDETVKAIKEGIENNKKSIYLFKIADSDYYVELGKDKWKPILENMINLYAEKEDYAKCIEFRELIKKM